MKKVLVIIFCFGLFVSAYAQRGYGHGGSFYRYRSFPRVSIGIGYSPFAPYYYGYGYPMFGYQPVYRVRSARLEMELQDIRADYRNRIWEARHDHSLSHHAKKIKIHELKREREVALIDARRDYYNRRAY